MTARVGVKYEWIIDEENFLKRNYFAMTNRQLANALDLTLTVVRYKCYELGLKRMELQRWTPEQIDFLRCNYENIGDTELTEMFTAKWDKPKGWTKKHIEKKRRYLKLKRTELQLKKIHTRNVKKGYFECCPVKAWKTRGQEPIGVIKVWRSTASGERSYIKTKTGYVVYARWMWEQQFGEIKDNMMVCLKDNKIIPESVADLYLISKADNAIRNKRGFDELPQDMKKAITLTNLIKKNL